MTEIALIYTFCGALTLAWDILRRQAEPVNGEITSWETRVLALRGKSRCQRESLYTQPANTVQKIKRACEALVKGTKTIDYPGQASMSTYYSSSAGRGSTAIYHIARRGEDRSALYDVSAQDHLRILHHEPHRYERLPQGGGRS